MNTNVDFDMKSIIFRRHCFSHKRPRRRFFFPQKAEAQLISLFLLIHCSLHVLYKYIFLMGKLHFLYMIDLLNENTAKIVSCIYFYFLVSAAGE